MQKLDNLLKAGFVRLPAIRSPIPISKSTFWAGTRTGRLRAPIRTDRIMMWSVEFIPFLIEQLEKEA